MPGNDGRPIESGAALPVPMAVDDQPTSRLRRRKRSTLELARKHWLAVSLVAAMVGAGAIAAWRVAAVLAAKADRAALQNHTADVAQAQTAVEVLRSQQTQTGARLDRHERMLERLDQNVYEIARTVGARRAEPPPVESEP